MANKRSAKSEAPRTSKRRETGLNIISELVSPEQVEVIKDKISGDNFGSRLLEHTVDFCYSDIWENGGLTRRERSLVTLGILIAQKAAPEMIYQFRIALKNGFTPRQLEEIILQALPYVGVPHANLANATAVQVLNELGLKTENRSVDD